MPKKLSTGPDITPDPEMQTRLHKLKEGFMRLDEEDLPTLSPAIPTFTVVPSCGGSVTLPAPADVSIPASDQESEHAEK